MKIYLITPRNPESFWTFDRILPTLGKKCVYPNLSMPTVAGLAGSEHEIVLCDENVGEIDFDTDADIVGITGYVIHKARILRIVEEFKRRDKFVVAGGPFATLCPEELSPLVDVVFEGEAEDTWPQFLEDFAAGCWRSEYRTDGFPSLEGRPPPRFDLLDVDAYRTMTLQFGRGCPYSCEFCDIIVMYGRRPRTKTVDQMLAEIEAVHRLGAETVFIVDDNFIGNRQLAKQLLRAIAAWQDDRQHPIALMTELTLNVAEDQELLDLLREANFTTVFIGIESPRAESLRETKKTQNLRSDMLESVKTIQRSGIEVMAGMIVGFDHDDVAIFEEQFRFIQDSGIAISMTGMLNALPRTPLYLRLRKEGRVLADSGGDQFVVTNVIPKLMSVRELYGGYIDLLQRLYDFDNYRSRAMSLVRRLGRRKVSRHPTRAQVATTLRFFWDCVLVAEPRRAWMTLRMIVATMFIRPSALGDAVGLALMHKHLFEYVEAVADQLEHIDHVDRSVGVTKPLLSAQH